MIKTKTEQVEQEIIEEILCNICGKSCKDDMDMNWELAQITASWGYASGRDCEVHEAHVCWRCYGKLEELFTIDPLVENL